VRAVNLFILTEGKTYTEIFSKIKTVYGKSVMNQMNMITYCCELNEGRTNINDIQSSKSPLILSDVRKIEETVYKDHLLTVDLILELLP